MLFPLIVAPFKDVTSSSLKHNNKGCVSIYCLWCNAALPLSSNPLRIPHLAIRSWSWDFFEILGLDTNTFWYNLLRMDAIWSRLVNFWWHDLISRSATSTYVWTGLFWSIPRWGVNTFITIGGSRFGTMWHAHIRSDAFISNQRDLLWHYTIVVQRYFTIANKNNHDLSYDLTRMVYIQPDWPSTSLCLSCYSTE